jgi:hypothetical protein
MQAEARAATAAPEFHVISAPRQLAVPELQPGNGVSQARAAAHNAGARALVEAIVNFEAATTATQRYQLATEAHDLRWASLQASAADFYAQAAATALAQAADAADAYVAVLQSEGVTSLPISAQAAGAYLERLRTQGYSPAEVEAMHAAGMSDAQIERDRQELLALAPERLAGDALTQLQLVATRYRAMAADLRAASRFGAGSAATARAAGSDHQLAQAAAIQRTIQVGNPFGAPATIDLRVRPIDLPPDWIVSVAPAQLTLQPGQQQAVTVTIVPGTAVQGSVAQAAVEGYAGDTLVDGVAFNVAVPERLAFTTGYSIFLPLVGN